MSKLVALFAALVTLQLTSVRALAEERAPAPAKEPRVGIGIDPLQMLGNLFSASLMPLARRSESGVAVGPSATIYVPINVLPWLRIEPAVSHVSFSSARSQSGGGAESSLTTSSRLTSLSLGTLYRFSPQASAVCFYAGPRVGVGLLASEMAASDQPQSGSPESMSGETSQINWSVAAAVGGEYYFARDFSLGADVEGGYQSFGQPESTVTRTPAPTSSSPATESKLSQNTTFTNATMRLRFYF